MKLFIAAAARYVCPKLPMHRLTAFLGVLLLACGLSVQGAKGGKPGGGGGGGTAANPQIAYVADDNQLKVMDADGSNQRLLAKASNGRIQNPFWHPNGQQIYFHRFTRESDNGLYRISLDGTGLIRVVALNPEVNGVTEGDVSPVPSAHGKFRIAFSDLVRENGLLYKRLFLANEDGTDIAAVPLGVGPSFGRPTWSPDGQSLAYVESYSRPPRIEEREGLRLLTFGEDDMGNIWVEDDVLLLSSNSLDGLGFLSITTPSFSKMQNKIFFSGSGGSGDSNLDLWALHLDSFMDPEWLERLTDTPAVKEWSGSTKADDSKIAYEDIGTGTIYLIDSDGANPVAMPRVVVKGKTETHRFPAFKR